MRAKKAPDIGREFVELSTQFAVLKRFFVIAAQNSESPEQLQKDITALKVSRMLSEFCERASRYYEDTKTIDKLEKEIAEIKEAWKDLKDFDSKAEKGAVE